MFGILFAAFCGLMLARIWRRPRWGMHAYGGYGPMHPMARGRYGRCGGPPCGGPHGEGGRMRSGDAPSAATSPGDDATRV